MSCKTWMSTIALALFAALAMQTPVEVAFSCRAEDAHSWPSKDQAQSQCTVFDSVTVKIDCVDALDYVANSESKIVSRENSSFCEESLTFKAVGIISSAAFWPT